MSSLIRFNSYNVDTSRVQKALLPERNRPKVFWTFWGCLMALLLMTSNLIQAQTGGALAFDGTNDYVSVPHNAAFNITGTISFEAWIKTTKTTQQYLMAKANDGIYIGTSTTTTGKFQVFLSNVTTGGWAASNANVCDGNWHHVAFTRNGTTLKLYVDGVLDNTITVAAAAIATGSSEVRFGARISQFYFNGTMDEVRLWDTERTATEIQDNRNVEFCGIQTGLVVYYKFNQGTAGGTNTGITTLTNASATAGINSTLTNFALTGVASNWVTGSGVIPQSTPVTPSVAIAANPSGTITEGTSVTFTATPTNGGATPTYQWKKCGANISGQTAATYTSTTLANADVITCVMTTSAEICASTATATSTDITMTVTLNSGPSVGLNFDGTDDYVQIANSTSLNNYISTGELTIEYWVKPEISSTQVDILSMRPTSNNAGLLIEVLNGNSLNNVNHYVFTSGGLKSVLIDYTVSTWQHIAMTAKQGDAIRVYKNGVLQGTTSLVGVTFTSTTSVLRLMGNTIPTGIAKYAKGSLDEVRIWSRALPQCEIQNNMNTELGSVQTGLVAYYKINENSGTSLTDASGNNNTGTLSNFALACQTSNWVAPGNVIIGTTPPAILTPTVTIGANPSGTITAGTSVMFTTTPTNGGTTPTYQWQKGGVNISGATAATYTSTTLANGDAITCVMTPSAEICAVPATATSNEITMTVTSALAVEWLDFKATPSVSGNVLTWTTANEVDNKGFQVERLMMNDDWSILGFVKAQGKSASYDFTDNAPLSTSYYRLRQIDNDGKETFSKVVSVFRNASTKLKAYPNPVSNILTVEATEQGNFQILNLLGQQVLIGKATQRIDVSALPQGSYFLKVGMEQVKFVKQ